MASCSVIQSSRFITVHQLKAGDYCTVYNGMKLMLLSCESGRILDQGGSQTEIHWFFEYVSRSNLNAFCCSPREDVKAWFSFVLTVWTDWMKTTFGDRRSGPRWLAAPEIRVTRPTAAGRRGIWGHPKRRPGPFEQTLVFRLELLNTSSD